MEDNTPFDLTRAIAEWRQRMARRGTFEQADLDELESHLRDSITALQAAGLSADEALLIASRRLGEPGVLDAEFRKLGGVEVLLDRAVWTCIAFQLFVFFSRPFGLPWIGVAAIAGLLLALFPSMRHFFKWWLARPIALSTILLFLGLAQKGVALWMFSRIHRSVRLPGEHSPFVTELIGPTWNSPLEFWRVAYRQNLLNVVPELLVSLVLVSALLVVRKKNSGAVTTSVR